MNNTVFHQLIIDGGLVGKLLIFFSIASFGIIFERYFHYHRAQLNVQEYLHGLFNLLRRNNTVEAISECDATPGPVAHILKAAILHCDQDEAGMRRAIEEASLMELPRLEARLKILATIAHIAPFLGLLGTVLAMMDLFATMETQNQFVATVDLAIHIKTALVTTAAGLCVAIPSYLFYNLLVGRIESITLDMEKASSEIIYFLSHNKLSLEGVTGTSTNNKKTQGIKKIENKPSSKKKAAVSINHVIKK